MNQTVEKRSQCNFVVKNDDVHVSDGRQMDKVRKATGAKSCGLGIKWRWRGASSLEDYSSDAVSQTTPKMSLDGRSPSPGQWIARAQIQISFPAHVRFGFGHHLDYLLFRQLGAVP